MSVYIPPPPPKAVPVKAGPIGPGAGPLLTELPLQTVLGRSPQQRMAKYMALAISVPWIRTAERVICGAIAGREWHLETPDGDTIDDTATDSAEQLARSLIATPQANLPQGRRLPRSRLWWLTARHLGVCGNAFWYLDALNVYGLPSSVLYIRPDRMTPKTDTAGNLVDWALDEKPGSPGMLLGLENVIQFVLDPPDTGHFGVGLVESALMKAQLATATDQHLAQVLDSGGRLAGIMSPKSDVIPPEVYDQIVRDARTIVEQPDAAKRLQILRAPVDFVPTVASPQELQVRDLMTGLRDDLLALWGLPLSQIGINTARGLNSGESQKYDEASLWQNAIHPRLDPFVETVQSELIDRWRVVGSRLTLIVDSPEFDDDGPRFDLVLKSVNLPMRNAERRELIGLDPTGDPTFDDAIYLPVTMAQVAVVPSAPMAARPAAPQMVAAAEPAKAELPPVNPFHGSMRQLRAQVERTMRAPMATNVRLVLDQQRRDIVARLRTNWAHLRANPHDESAWWHDWDTPLRNALAPTLGGVAQVVSEHVHATYPKVEGKADPVARILDHGGARIGGINETTRRAVAEAIAEAFAEGAELDDVITRINALPAFDSYRSELISRTELMDAYNAAALGAYGDAGITYVQAIDGDGDAQCAARDGQILPLDDAGTIEDHPNGTLDWIPVIGQGVA